VRFFLCSFIITIRLPWYQGEKTSTSILSVESKNKNESRISGRIKLQRHFFQHQNNNPFLTVNKLYIYFSNADVYMLFLGRRIVFYTNQSPHKIFGIIDKYKMR